MITHGRWEQVCDSYGKVQHSRKYDAVTAFGDGDTFKRIASRIENPADARLIAAAPELAELLRDLVSEGLNVASKSIHDPFRFKLEQARAALAKAGVL